MTLLSFYINDRHTASRRRLLDLVSEMDQAAPSSASSPYKRRQTRAVEIQSVQNTGGGDPGKRAAFNTKAILRDGFR